MSDDVTIDGLVWNGEDWVEPKPEKYWNEEGGYYQDVPPKRGGYNVYPPYAFKLNNTKEP